MDENVYVLIMKLGQGVGSCIIEGVYASLDTPMTKLIKARNDYRLDELNGRIKILREGFYRDECYWLDYFDFETNQNESTQYEIEKMELRK